MATWHVATERQSNDGLLGAGSFSFPLSGGDAGVAETIAAMQALVDSAVKDPAVNRYANEILRGQPSFNPENDARTIYEHVRQNFRYVMDPIGPLGPKEVLRPVRDLLVLGGGDCDDLSVLLAALLGTVGYRTRFITVAADRNDPSQFSHIYPEVFLQGEWIAVDAARPGAQFGRSPETYWRKREWNPEDGGYHDMSGLARVTLQGLGEDPNVLAQDIAASGLATAQIVAAANAQNPNIFANLSPGQTSYLPGGTLSPFGAPVPTVAASATPGALIALLALGGIALIFVLKR